MKIQTHTITKQIPQYERYCDFYPKEKAVSSVEIIGGYGSDHDLEKFTFDLCDKGLEELLDFFKKKTKSKKLDIFITMLGPFGD